MARFPTYVRPPIVAIEPRSPRSARRLFWLTTTLVAAAILAVIAFFVVRAAFSNNPSLAPAPVVPAVSAARG